MRRLHYGLIALGNGRAIGREVQRGHDDASHMRPKEDYGDTYG